MRSRYAAYSSQLPDYIISTTHPDNVSSLINKQEILRFCKNTEFINLKIIDFSEHDDTAYVTFHAVLKQNGSDASFTEKSSFKKVDGAWLYHARLG